MQVSCEIYRCEDGSIMVEVYGQDWRVGLAASANPKDCGWFTVGRSSSLDTLGDLANGDRLFRVLDTILPPATPPDAGS